MMNFEDFHMFDGQLVGVCGIYCGACMIYRACNDQDQVLMKRMVDEGLPVDMPIHCEGCTSGDVFTSCVGCRIRNCAKEKGISLCSDCKEQSCEKLKVLVEEQAKRNNLPHLRLCSTNLKSLKQVDVEEWLKQQGERWSCKSCGKRLHWYSENCPQCGAKFYNAVQEAGDLKKTQR
jgi:hypothetical protein